jgi:hypothetical protein
MSRYEFHEQSLDELLAGFNRPTAEPGSIVNEAMRSALAARIAELLATSVREAAEVQRDAATAALAWAKLSATGQALSGLVATAALLIALF